MSKVNATTAVAKAKPAAQMVPPWGKPGLVIPTQDALAGKPTASVPAVKQIVTLSRRMIELENEIAQLNDEVGEKSKQLTRLRMVDIPNAMSEAGTKNITLDSGEVVKVEDFVTGNIKEENREAAHAWLRENGFGSLIKHVVSCAFGMGEDKQANKVIVWLVKAKITFEQKEAVNTQTLRAFVRERLSAGKALPPSIDYTTVPTATIKRVKEK